MKLIDLVNKVENKYGSINEAPYECKELKACRKFVSGFKTMRNGVELNRGDAANNREIAKQLYYEGYSIREIAEKMEYSVSQVRCYLNYYNLPFKGLTSRDRFKLWQNGGYVGEGTMKSLAKQIDLNFGQLAEKYINADPKYTFKRI